MEGWTDGWIGFDTRQLTHSNNKLPPIIHFLVAR